MAITATGVIGGALAGAGAVAAINTTLAGAGLTLTALGALGVIGIGAAGQGYLAYQNKQEMDELNSKVAGLSTGGYSFNQKGAGLHRQIVYGKTKIGGVVVFDDAGGTDNKYLSRIIAYAAHEVDEFEEIFIDDYKVTAFGANGSVATAQKVDEKGNLIAGTATAKFANYITIRKVYGNHTTSLNGQSVTVPDDSSGTQSFSSKWTSSHVLSGVAHLAVLFKFQRPETDTDVEVYENGLPTITAIVRGKKVYDPRTATTAWSDNPALIVRDYLTNTDYGLGEDTANIDDTRLITAANVCDETVTTDSSTRYTCNGAWLTSKVPADLLGQIVGTCAGTLWYAQGEWRLRAGKYVAPTIALTEDDLRSPLSISTRHSRRENFNGVRGIFKGPASNYQPTDYPLVSSQTFIDVDGGLESVLDFPLPFTDSPGEAQRLANIALERNRSQITLTGAFGLKAFELQVGDFVSLSNTRLGFDPTATPRTDLFEVINWSFGLTDNNDLQTNLILRETTTTTYDEYQDVDFESDNTDLPGILGPTVIPGSGDVSSTTNVTGLTASGGVREIYVNWSNPVNDDFSYTRIYYDNDNNISGASTQNVTGESFVLDNLSANDTRYFWAQAYDTSNNTLGAQIGPVSATVKDITSDDLENGSVINSKLGSQAVQSGNIFPASVVTDKIGDNAVSELVAFSFSSTSVPASFSAASFFEEVTNTKACDIVLEANFEINGTPASGDILYCEAIIDGATTAPGREEIFALSDAAVGDRTVIVFKGGVGASNFDIEAKVRRATSASSTSYTARCNLIVHRLFK
jgi:hypothetical protein